MYELYEAFEKKSYMWEQYVYMYMQVVQFIGQNVYSR